MPTPPALSDCAEIERDMPEWPMRRFRYLSVCSGIEAATVAWHPLGWEAAAFSEIEAFPRAVLAHHYPDVPCHGDFTTIGADEYGPIDLLVGGTPCQSFSIAGLRGGLADDRGNLALEFLRLAQRTGAKWLVWENVPGVLSSNGGRDFGAILGGMVELGYGVSYRVLDAQHFGVPQRRRRVFVVGYLGDWRRAAAVLFERHSLSGHSAPHRRGGSTVAGTLAAGAHPGGHNGQDAYNGQLIPFSIMPMNSGTDYVAREAEVAQPVMAGGPVGGNQGGDFIACRVSGNAGAWDTGDRTDALTSANDGAAQHLIAFTQNQRNEVRELVVAGALSAEAGMKQTTYVRSGSVRKMTPREWERLQGFPDDYTLVPYRGKPAADGPRYKALGNSMAVPVMAWIGQRIAQVEAHPLHNTPAQLAQSAAPAVAGFDTFHKAAVLVPNARNLPLMVSQVDRERVLAKAWVVNPLPDGGWDAGNNFWVKGRMKRIHLSRFILDAPVDLMVDHINGNRLDNRRESLRLATAKQNSCNRPSGGGQSKYKGVCRSTAAKTWRAYIGNNRKQIHLGCFPSEIEAACAYDDAARHMFGDFACLNFPDVGARSAVPNSHDPLTTAEEQQHHVAR